MHSFHVPVYAHHHQVKTLVFNRLQGAYRTTKLSLLVLQKQVEELREEVTWYEQQRLMQWEASEAGTMAPAPPQAAAKQLRKGGRSSSQAEQQPATAVAKLRAPSTPGTPSPILTPRLSKPAPNQPQAISLQHECSQIEKPPGSSQPAAASLADSPSVPDDSIEAAHSDEQKKREQQVIELECEKQTQGQTRSTEPLVIDTAAQQTNTLTATAMPATHQQQAGYSSEASVQKAQGRSAAVTCQKVGHSMYQLQEPGTEAEGRTDDMLKAQPSRMTGSSQEAAQYSDMPSLAAQQLAADTGSGLKLNQCSSQKSSLENELALWSADSTRMQHAQATAGPQKEPAAADRQLQAAAGVCSHEHTNIGSMSAYDLPASAAQQVAAPTKAATGQLPPDAASHEQGMDVEDDDSFLAALAKELGLSRLQPGLRSQASTPVSAVMCKLLCNLPCS